MYKKYKYILNKLKNNRDNISTDNLIKIIGLLCKMPSDKKLINKNLDSIIQLIS